MHQKDGIPQEDTFKNNERISNNKIHKLAKEKENKDVFIFINEKKDKEEKRICVLKEAQENNNELLLYIIDINVDNIPIHIHNIERVKKEKSNYIVIILMM